MIKGNVNPDNEFGRVSVQNCRIKLRHTLDRPNEGIGYRWIRNRSSRSISFLKEGSCNNHNFPLPPQSSPPPITFNVIIEGTENRVQKRWRFSIFHEIVFSLLSSRRFRVMSSFDSDRSFSKRVERARKKKKIYSIGEWKMGRKSSGTFGFLIWRPGRFLLRRKSF